MSKICPDCESDLEIFCLSVFGKYYYYYVCRCCFFVLNIKSKRVKTLKDKEY